MPILAFDPASAFLLLVLILLSPTIIVVAIVLMYRARRASQEGEATPPREDERERPMHTHPPVEPRRQDIGMSERPPPRGP